MEKLTNNEDEADLFEIFIPVCTDIRFCIRMAMMLRLRNRAREINEYKRGLTVKRVSQPKVMKLDQF